MSLVTVLDHKFYPTSASEKHTGPLPKGRLMNLKTALETTWETDAYVVLYGHAGPRLCKADLSPDSPEYGTLMVDVDCPGHKSLEETDPAWTADVLRKFQADPACGYYSTRGGFRAFWILDEPVPLMQAGDMIRQWMHKCLVVDGIPVDTATKDWTRLFRLPRVTRDGVVQVPLYERWPTETLKWTGKLSAELTTTVDRDIDIPDLPDSPMPMEVFTEMGLDAKTAYALSAPLPLAAHGERHLTHRSVAMKLANTTAEPTADWLWACLAPSYQKTVEKYGDTSLLKIWNVCLEITSVRRGERENADHLRKILGKAMVNVDKQDDPLERLLLYHSTSETYFVYQPLTAGYAGPFGQTQARIKFAATAKKIQLLAHNKWFDNLADYSTLYTDTSYTYTGGSSFKDGKVSICPLQSRNVEAVYHPEIAAWLKSLGGTQHVKLLDWLSTFRRLGEPTCALYVEGVKGSGKSLLAVALARFWSGEPMDYSKAASKFNDRLAKMPLIIADEVKRGVKDATFFRQLVGGAALSVEVKNGPQISLEGYPRLILTANNDHFFRNDSSSTLEDLDAVRSRVAHIKITLETNRYLDSLGGFNYIHPRWVKGDGVIQHVTWLEENHKYKPRGRWLVEGWASRQSLIVQNDLSHEILATIQQALEMKIPLSRGVGTDPDDPTSLLVTSTWLADALQQKHVKASTREITDSLKTLSGAPSIQKRVGPRNLRLYRIPDFESLLKQSDLT